MSYYTNKWPQYNNNGYNGRGRGKRDYDNGGGQRSRRREATPPQLSDEDRRREDYYQLFVRFGDGLFAERQTLEALANTVLTAYRGFPAEVLTAFCACLVQLPQKSSVWGTLTGLINVRDHEVASSFVGAACQTLQDALNSNELRTVKITLRYIAELVNANVILPAQLIGLFDVFLTVLDEHELRVERADAFVYIILATIPWVSAQLHERTPNELNRVLTRIETYMGARKANAGQAGIARAFEALKTYRDLPDGEPYDQDDRLELLWAQIKQLANADEWNVKLFLRTSVMFETDFTAGETHELKVVTIPGEDVSIKFSYHPKFWVFDDSVHSPENAIVKLPSQFSISRFIFDDLIYDIIRIFSLNHKECSRFLRDLPQFFDEGYLQNNGYNVMAAVTETLFSEMLRLPRSQERSMYYATLLIDLVKEDPSAFPKVLGRAIRLLYNRLDGQRNLSGGMDVECIRRLSEWFAVHLSNFNYAWKWQDWEGVLSADRSSGRFVFIKETLEKCIRLSYYDRVKGSVPANFVGELLPAVAPGPRFKYESAEATGDAKLHELISDLQKQLSKKAGPEEVRETLQKIRNHAAGKPLSSSAMNIDSGAEEETDMGSGVVLGDPKQIAREVLVQCLLKHGSLSFSHFLNVTERYVGPLRECNERDDDCAHTVRIIADFWAESPQNMEIVFDKLMNYRVVDPLSILRWLLSDEMLTSSFNGFAIWSILHTTLRKVIFKGTQIEAKRDAARATANMDPAVVQQLDGAVSNALQERKQAFTLVFQRLVEFIQNRLIESDQQGIDAKATPWWRWVVGGFREVARGFPSEVQGYRVLLDGAVIVPGQTDPRLVQVWEEVKWVYERHTDNPV
ncbi:Nuclear cap-binding protein subunit 1 [Rhizophlyctis rosea]|nr:Nuclear cap-binding protein subunit 1 [Rhizophlyctis rosea]